MRNSITNNVMDANIFSIPATDILSPLAVLKSVKAVYEKDSEGQRTNKVQAYRYELVDMKTYSSFTVRVMGDSPVVSPEELEKTDDGDLLIVELPLDKTIIKPYEIAYGRAKVSITIPYIKLHVE